jgi:hypothetical protein
MDAVETIRQIKGLIEDWESGEENAAVVVLRISAVLAARATGDIGPTPPPEIRS